MTSLRTALCELCEEEGEWDADGTTREHIDTQGLVPLPALQVLTPEELVP